MTRNMPASFMLLLFSSLQAARSTEVPNLSERQIRWGIMGTGHIAADMVRVLSQLEGTRIAAIGSRSTERAEDFVAAAGIDGAKLYGSYEDLVADGELDVVYVATPSLRHVDDAIKCLRAGHAVLCEKSMAPSVEEAVFVLDLARRKRLFFLHGVWSRFFPAMAEIRRVIASGVIGDVRSAHASFCQNDGAGSCSAALETGIYCAQFLLWAFPGQTPSLRGVCAHRAEGCEHEDHVSALLQFKQGVGTLECSLRHASAREATICGTKGIIRVPFPFWCPTSFTVQTMSGLGSQAWSDPVEHHTPLPSIDGPFNFVNSQGLAYEAMAVNSCLRKGLTEADAFGSDECLRVMQVVTALREAAVSELR
uniref:D-xylose 1-dehydrogenase (NADP(+), D-xylono-1,5-lactone-forming) n=1 Tax=Coccolithus braarudii TaxID=221442 RepID=A0A7S0LRW1_9EUKA|mmetsp:Transcript_5492/g.12107  ORF Transcript_5492/g.12107 Transcript_5492/m.12107 type:complete len:365 (+) Transcript_5492:3-1097(+)